MKKIILLLTCLCIFIPMISTVSADSTDDATFETVIIAGTTYKCSSEETSEYNIYTVVSETGEKSVSVYNKVTGEIQIDNEQLQVEEVMSSPLNARAVDSGGGTGTKVLSTNKYTISGTVAVILTGLMAVYSPYSWAQVVALITGVVSTTVTLTITKYRSGNKEISGTNKGKYKYWTGVHLKHGSKTILDTTHSVYWQ